MEQTTFLGGCKYSFIILVILGMFSATLSEEQKQADSTNEAALEELSLADLLNTEITVTSDQPDRVSDAPGTVTAFSKKNMIDFGYFTIGDLAELTPGYSTQYYIADRMLETRGGFSSLNEKHLLRVDGIPINNVRSGTAYIQEGLPLLFADKVEFLRGPASALYGIGAFNGVINILTKEKLETGASANTRFSFGTDINGQLENYVNNRDHDPVFHKQAMGNVAVKGEKYYLDANIGYFDRKADMLTWTEGRGDSAGYNMNNYRSIFSKISQKMMSDAGDFTLGLFYINQHTGYGLGWASWANEPTTTKANWHEWRSVIPYLKHDVDISDNVSLSTHVKYHNGHERGTQTNKLGWWIPDLIKDIVIKEINDTTNDTLYDTLYHSKDDKLGIFGYNISTHNWELYSKITHEINENFNYIIGYNYDIRWNSRQETWTRQSLDANLFEQFYDEKSHTNSLFGQIRAVVPVLADMILTGGVRLDIGKLSENIYVQPSPRAALVQRFTENIIGKAMYGTALKAPGIQELGHNDEKMSQIIDWNNANPDSVARGLDELEAEVLHTFEGNLTFVNDLFYVSATYFNNTIKEQLQRLTPWSDINSDFWFNARKDAKAQGGELEVRVAFPFDMYLLTSGSYTQTEDQDGDPIEYLPIVKGNFGISKHFDFGLALSGVVKFVPYYTTSETKTLADNSTKTIGKDTTSSNVFIDLNFAQRLNDRMQLELKVINLIDKQIPFTERMPIRSVLLTLSSEF